MYKLEITKIDDVSVTIKSHAVRDIARVQHDLEKLYSEYKEYDLSMSDYIYGEPDNKALRIELWTKNNHDEEWVGKGDYFFLQNEELENEIEKIIKQNL